MTRSPIRLCFLIRSLDCGGSQRQLAELVRHLDTTKFDITVLTFYPGGLLWNTVLETPGVRLVCLGKSGRWDLARFTGRLVRILRRLRPDVIHGYGVVANELAWLAGRAAGGRVVWGLRASKLELNRYDWTVRASLKVSAKLSRHVDLVISNSIAGMQYYVGEGFDPDNLTVIPNGIDTHRFRQWLDARNQLRGQWALGPSDFLFGLLGRLDPMKGHATFLEAMACLAERHPRVRAVCIGDSLARARRYLSESPAARSLGARLRWEPAREDVELVLPALDALVLSSDYGEGFPNVVGEAMATEVPSIVTDVGDAARVLDDPVRTIPPRNTLLLRNACEHLLELSTAERRRIGRNDRRRIVAHFSAPRLAEHTTALLEALAGRPERQPDGAGFP